MKQTNTESIFSKYAKIPNELKDRIKETNEEGVDIIIPLINTNELFERNLHNFYEQIPIKRLIIGDGGCTDNSIEIANKFPRVTVLDQSEYISQGYAIKKLIEAVNTEFFIYLHADVFLPDGWFNAMASHKEELDWFECNRQITVLFEYPENAQNNAERAYSGSQMGRTKSFDKVLPLIKDDFLQRNEDIIFMELIKKTGGKYDRISDTFHYHQTMNKRGESEPKIERISIKKEEDKEWIVRIYMMQAKGIIQYLDPKKYLVSNVNDALYILDSHDALNWSEFKTWVLKTNAVWLKHIKKNGTIRQITKKYYTQTIKKHFKK